MIPELDIARVRRWVDARNDKIPEHARGLTRYELVLTHRTVTFLECRPPWKPRVEAGVTRLAVARLRYTRSRGRWSLYWLDRNLKYHKDDLVAPTPVVDKLIAEIEREPTSNFWG